MKRSTMFATLLGVAAVVCVTPALTKAASAAELGTSWNYQYDAVGDGSGGNSYDIRGMAMTIQGDNVYVALTGGTPLSGVAENGVTNGTISWGDLFFNFSGKNFQEAQAAGQLFGVRFASSNDSAVATGVYSGVKTQSVAEKNDGYSSMQQYYDYGWGNNGYYNFDYNNTHYQNSGNTQLANNSQGSALASQEQVLDYYGRGSVQNSIASGTKLGEVSMLLTSDLSNLGLNFGDKAGDQTFGFSFNKNLLPNGNFLANVLLECGNDGMAFSASNSAAGAPEPTTMAGAALGIAAIAGLKRRRKQIAH